MRDTVPVERAGPVSCVYCGTALDPAARFCGACGRPIPDSPSSPAAFEIDDTEVTAAGKRRADSHSETLADTRSPLLPSLVPSASDPYVGSVLKGRFQIESKLGEGGFGAVYRGVQLGTGRIVAIKLLHPDMTRDKNVVARFRREGQVLCNLRDAHTITTYDFDQTEDGTLFIAMELLEGRSLHDVFHTEAPIAWRRMVKFIAECCSSLSEAHQQGIIHRDLKPENIHLERRSGNPEFVKILDFGIAKVVHGEGFGNGDHPQLTATGQTLGTLEYMSPEQLMGKQLDGRSDIYGLGVVAYELLTGRLPYPDATGPAQLIAAQLKKIPGRPSESNPRIPPGVDALILRMLEKSRDNRFANVEELRRACESLLAGGSDSRISAVSAPPAEPAIRGAFRPQLPPSEVPGPMPTPQPDMMMSSPHMSMAHGYSRPPAAPRQNPWVLVAVIAVLAGAIAVGIVLAVT